jgi:hypothetical protein
VGGVVDAGTHFHIVEAGGVFGAALVLAEPAVVVAGLVGVGDGVGVDGAGGGEGEAVGVVGAAGALQGAGGVGEASRV